MGFDFSALDAELDALGQAPADAGRLAEQFAGGVSGLAQVDAALDALAQDVVPMAGVAVALPSVPSDAPPDAAGAADSLPPPAEAAAPQSLPPPAQAREAESLPPPVEAAAPQSPPPAQAAPTADDQAIASAAPSEPPASSQPPLGLEPASEAATAPSEAPAAPAGSSLLDDLFSEPPVQGAPSTPASDRPPSDWPALSGPSSSAPPASSTLTQSQEIVLPDPIAGEELSHESGELRLDGGRPGSGSFSLPDETTPVDHKLEVPPQGLSDLVDDVQDALEGSQPLSLAAPARAELPLAMDRDPDAEFDALLSEATDPRGIPTGSSASEFDADELLRGLEGDEAELNIEASFAEPEGDTTEVIDRNVAALAAGMLPQAQEGEDILSDELDADDLEIVMDDDEPATKAPPPPPPASASSAPEKRPSFLGRLFSGKRDE